MSDLGSPASFLRVDTVAVAPGQPTSAQVTIENRGPVSATWNLRVIGLEPEWVQTEPLGPVAPGQVGRGRITVTVPLGHPASDLVASVLAEPTSDSAATATGAQADLHVLVGDGSQIAAMMDPATPAGGGRAKFDLLLRNRGRSPLQVNLSSFGPDPDLRVHFADPAPLLPPGVETRIPARVSAHRHAGGPARRRPFGIRIQGHFTPISLDGTFVQRPTVGTWFTKAAAVVAVVALWVAVAAVGIQHLSNHLKTVTHNKTVANTPISLPAGPTAGSGVSLPGSAPSPASLVPSSGGGGSRSGSGSGSGSGLGSGSGRSSAAGSRPTTAQGLSAAPPSAVPPATTKTASLSPAAAANPSPSLTTRVYGKVQAADPSSVTVTITPETAVDETAQGANFSNSGTAGGGTGGVGNSGTGGSQAATASKNQPLGKVYATLVSSTVDSGTTAAVTPTEAVSTPPAQTTPAQTTPDGSWAFSGVRAPGDYLVTFSKPGYATSRYLVTTADATPVELSASIAPGTGALSGMVSGPGGPLGGVDLTITDGTVTIHTRTPTIGAVGSWSVTGLTTPDTYLVTATLDGYGTQTAVAQLGPGDSHQGINMTMTPGVGSLTGTVTSSRSGAGVGGLKVTATDGTTSLTVTTTTTNPVGSYTIPDLPIPGTYALTVSGSGWVSQTQQVILTGNAVVNASVTQTTADVTGVITDDKGAGLAGAGVILSNNTNTFKTLTQSATPVGGFDFGQVPPGQYVLTATEYGYTPASTNVTVGPGDIQTVDLSLTFVGTASIATAAIEGAVTDLFNASPVANATLALDGVATNVTSQSNGNYLITGVGPGIHTVTATANGFEPASVQVTVPLGATVFAPPILLPILDKVGGVVIDNATNQPVPNPTVTMTSAITGQVAGVQTSTISLSGVPPPAQGGFEVDNLPHGNYTLSVSAPSTSTTSYVPKTGIQVTLALDTNQLFVGAQALTLDEAPAYHVDTLLSAGGAPAYQSGVTVTMSNLTQPGLANITGTSPTTGEELTLGPLVAGNSYQISYSYTSGSGAQYSAPAKQFTAVVNNTAVDTAILYQQITTDTHFTLTFPYRTPTAYVNCLVATSQPSGSPCPSVAAGALPMVTVTGTIGYQTSSPGVAGAPITSNVAVGTDGSGMWTLTAAGAGAFVSPSVTVSIGEPLGMVTFGPLSGRPATLGTNASFALQPTASPVSGTVSPTSGVSVAVAAQTNGVTVTAGVTAGALQFSDGVAGQADAAEPGTYTLTFSSPGYDSAQATLTVGLCTSACSTVTTNPATLTLVHHVALTVNVTDTTALPLVQPAGSPTVLLYAGSSGPLLQTQTLAPAGTSVTFSDLSVTNSVVTPLVVVVQARGYRTATLSNIVLGSASYPVTANTVTAGIQVTEEGWITGQVTATIGTATGVPLAGATVTAVDTSASPTCNSTSPPSAVSDVNGDLVIVGDPARGDGGLCVGDTYQLTTVSGQPNGYTAGPAVTVTVAPGATPATGVTMTAAQLTLTITVDDGTAAANAVPGLSVKALSGTAPAATYTAQNSCASHNPPASCKVVTLQIYPTVYTFTLSAPGFATLSVGPIAYQAGTSPTLSVSMTANYTVTGQVTTAAPGGSTAALPGVTVSLLDSKGKTVMTAQTDSNGNYTIGDATSGYVPYGTYSLTAALPGYTLVAPSPGTFTTNQSDSVENLSMTLNGVSVMVNVTNTLNISLNNTTVTLTEDTNIHDAPATCSGTTLVRGLGTTTQTGTVNSGRTTIPSVTPDLYSLVVSGTTNNDGPLPAPASATLVTVCPANQGQTVNYQLQIGEINGQVTLSPPSTSTTAASASVSVTGGALTLTPSVTCVSSSTDCSVGSYSTLVDLGPTYSVSASVTDPGYSSPAVTGGLTPTSSTPTVTPSTTINAVTQNVTVTVSSQTNLAMTLPGATVTLDDFCNPHAPTTPCHTYTGTTGTAITGVVPDDINTYNVSVTRDGVSATGTISVPVAASPSGGYSLNIPAAFSTVSGTVAVASPATATVAITNGGCTAADLTVGSTGAYGPCYVAAGRTYTVTFTAGSLTATAHPAVTDGTPIVEDATAVTVPVVDSSSHPVSGASVTVTANSSNYSATTDASGNAVVLISAPDGTAVSLSGTASGTVSGNPATQNFTGSMTPGTAETLTAVQL